IKYYHISLVCPHELMPEADQYVDVTGKYVFPGAIDAHCHFENAEIVNIDDWTSGPMAAAHAGITTLVPFAHWNFAKTKSLTRAIADKIDEVAPQSVLDFGLHFILPKRPASPDGLTEAVGEAARMGVNSYKMFMAYKKRGIICRDDHIARVMESVAAHHGVVMLHCENGDVLDYLE